MIPTTIVAVVLIVLFIAAVTMIAIDADPTMFTPPPPASDVHPLVDSFDRHADQAMELANGPLFVPAEWIREDQS